MTMAFVLRSQQKWCVGGVRIGALRLHGGERKPARAMHLLNAKARHHVPIDYVMLLASTVL